MLAERPAELGKGRRVLVGMGSQNFKALGKHNE